jgi:hypothetical protein
VLDIFDVLDVFDTSGKRIDCFRDFRPLKIEPPEISAKCQRDMVYSVDKNRLSPCPSKDEENADQF